MFKHYLKTAIRNIIRDKVYSIINILGLSIGLACSFFLIIYIISEFRYDHIHEKRDRIFRIISEDTLYKEKFVNVPLILGSTIKEEFPEIENYTRTYPIWDINIKKDNEYIKEKNIYCCDNGFFDIFTYPLIAGDKTHLLTEPNSVVISEKIAKKYFNNLNPIGQALSIKTTTGEYNLKVTGITKDISMSSSFYPELITNINLAYDEIKTSTGDNNAANQWSNEFACDTYILLKENANIIDLQNKMSGFEKRHSPKNNLKKYSFQSLIDIYFQSNNLGNSYLPQGDYESIKLFSIIVILILLIAGINYIILSTARASHRTKEIGMRKVFGANKAMLVKQVLSESVLVTLMALPIAIFFVKIFLPYINKIIGKDFIFTFSESINYLASFALITILIGLLSGSYLSIYLARLQPIIILRNRKMSRNHRNYFRKAMIIIQLIIFIVLCLSTSLVFRQLHYIYKKDMGFNKENLLIIHCSSIGQKYISFKNEIKTNTNIINVCVANTLPPDYYSGGIMIPKADNPNEPIKTELIITDNDFIKTYQIKIIKGNNFTENDNNKKQMLMNETAINEIGLKLSNFPFNNNIRYKDVIGVIKDFDFHSLHTKIQPLVLARLNKNQWVSQMAVRIKPENKVETIKYLEKKWKEISKEPFEYYFIDDKIAMLYKKEILQAKIMRIFAFFAIFIAMLGLFGLSLFTSQQRTKEIGIRKVHGANIGDIMRLLSKEYIVLVVIANIIAAPIAFYFMNKWLQNFAYPTKIEWWLFALVFLLSLVIVLLTVSWQAYRAAKTNPVETLKYE